MTLKKTEKLLFFIEQKIDQFISNIFSIYNNVTNVIVLNTFVSKK